MWLAGTVAIVALQYALSSAGGSHGLVSASLVVRSTSAVEEREVGAASQASDAGLDSKNSTTSDSDRALLATVYVFLATEDPVLKDRPFPVPWYQGDLPSDAAANFCSAAVAQLPHLEGDSEQQQCVSSLTTALLDAQQQRDDEQQRPQDPTASSSARSARGPTQGPSVPVPISMEVVMPDIALHFLDLLILQLHTRGAQLYFEWGSGGSTSWVAPLAQRAWSVDNNKEWCTKVAGRPDIQFWVVNGVLTLVCVEMGPTQPWGFPSPVSSPALFLDYVNAIEASGHNAFDVVMVDGRFRVACGLKALWHLAPSGKLVVHDWERVWYHEPLLRFYNILEVTATGQMVVLTPKTLSDQQWHQARTLLDEYSATAF